MVLHIYIYFRAKSFSRLVCTSSTAGQLSSSSWQQLSAKTSVGFSTEDFATSVNSGSVLVARFCATFAGWFVHLFVCLFACVCMRACLRASARASALSEVGLSACTYF